MRRKPQRDPLPDIPIAAVLLELTGVDVPTGFGWLRIQCPFHEDRTPSAGVNHDRNGFHCHSCGRHGDSLKLLQTERGLTFLEALNQGKLLAGVTDSQPSKTRTRRASDLLKR